VAEMVRRCGCAGEADFSDCGLYGWINIWQNSFSFSTGETVPKAP
jgi:hypothetical protein